MDPYQSFIDRKSQLQGDFGFEPTFVPDYLFDFQQSLVEWSVRKGRAALFVDTGLGKTLMELVWAENIARKTGKPVLILTPLAVAEQTVREAIRFGIRAEHSRRGEFTGQIVVANYERLHLFDSRAFGGVVCDECFPAGTEVDTPTGRKHIENITIGDKIVNAYGVDTVADVHRREVPYAIRITVNGETIVSSPNHPYFTRSGWKGAMDLIPGDEIMATSASLRMVRERVHGKNCASREDEVLQSILLSEMADESARTFSESAYAGISKETWRETKGLARVWITESTSGDRTYSHTQSNEQSRDTIKNLPHIESDEPRTFRAWGKWEGPYGTTIDDDGNAWFGMDSGVFIVTGETNSRLSNELQARLSESRDQNRHRGGWELASQSKNPRHKEGRETRFARVDRLEVLEPGHPELDQFRDADGKLYFYDLGATRHPSFSIHGLLVHNSSILKNFDGTRRKEITEFMRMVPYRLLATATAAPNDYIELGTSSEALGHLGYMDMLTRFFTNKMKTSHAYHGKYRIKDRDEWRFKGHAEQAFWRWVTSWARAVRRPSDLGFRDDRFILPELIERETLVQARTIRQGMLFDIPAKGFFEEREMTRRTIAERCERVAEMVNGTTEQAVVWCHLNDEGDLLEKLIPDAVQVSGRDDDDRKEEKLISFTDGTARVIISKPKIACYGLNWQHCNMVTFFPSHSYEQYYQAVRRCWRFGQTRPVTVDIVGTDGDADVLENMQRKAIAADRMFSNLVAEMNNSLSINRSIDFTTTVEVPAWMR